MLLNVRGFILQDGKLLRINFDLKYKQLHDFDAKGGNKDVRDKLRATLKKLDTRLMVAIRAIHAASLRVRALTNEELYPQLCEMLEGYVLLLASELYIENDSFKLF